MNFDDLILRRPELADAKTAQRFINRLVEEGALIGEDEPQTLAQEEKFLEALLAAIDSGQASYNLAEYKGQMIGGSMVQRGRGRHKHVATLGISVDRDFRRIGLGERLTILAINDAQKMKGVNLLKLPTFATNNPAIALYKKLGFKEIACVPDEWLVNGHPVDLIIMHRRV